MTAELEWARERLAAAGHRLAGAGLVLGTAGNLSTRVGDLVAVTPTGAPLERLAPAQVAVVDLDGRHVEGEFEPSSEIELHLGIYRRYGAGAVVHTHAPLATALSCVLEELPVIHYQMLELGGPIRVVPYTTFGTRELADAALEALRDRSAVLLSNHGPVVHAPELDGAVERSLLLEWACEVYWRAAAVGSPRTLDTRQQATFTEAVEERGYGTLQPRSSAER